MSAREPRWLHRALAAVLVVAILATALVTAELAKLRRAPPMVAEVVR